MKILLLKFRHIGDVLLSTPLIENLARHFPHAKIDYALNRDCAEMIARNPRIRNVITYDREKIKRQNFTARIASELRFAMQLRRARYDLVISLTEGDRSAALALFCGAPRRFGFRPPKGIFHYLPVYQRTGVWPSGHMIEKDLQFIKFLGKEITTRKVAIHCAPHDEQTAAKILARHRMQKFVHVHAVSRWMYKCIADETMANVIDHCATQGYPAVITASPAENEMQRTARITSLCKSNPLNLAGKLTLKQVAALNRNAAFFIGVDTAIMHISAANNTPTFAFFGPSRARSWGPWDNAQSADAGYADIAGNNTQRMGKHMVQSVHCNCLQQGSTDCMRRQIGRCLMAPDFAAVKKAVDAMVAAAG